MLYTPKISGQAKSFRRAMLAHLQGISHSAGGTPYNFYSQCFWQKMLVCFFCIGASICIGWETIFLLYVGFFIPYLRRKLVISYSYFSIGKIIVLAFLHTLKIIHSWDKVVIKFIVSQPHSDQPPPTLYLWHNNLLLRNCQKFYSKHYKQ